MDTAQLENRNEKPAQREAAQKQSRHRNPNVRKVSQSLNLFVFQQINAMSRNNSYILQVTV